MIDGKREENACVLLMLLFIAICLSCSPLNPPPPTALASRPEKTLPYIMSKNSASVIVM